MSKNDLTFAYRVNALPGPTPRVEVLNAMMRAVLDGSGELPPGYDVTWQWRNAAHQDLREDDFQTVVRESRGGFLKLMLGRLQRDGGTLDVEPREATPREVALIERAEAETAERREAARRPGQATRRRRRAAALKGWATRRRNIRAAQRAAAARARAARKGWETRRRNARRKGRRR